MWLSNAIIWAASQLEFMTLVIILQFCHFGEKFQGRDVMTCGLMQTSAFFISPAKLNVRKCNDMTVFHISNAHMNHKTDQNVSLLWLMFHLAIAIEEFYSLFSSKGNTLCPWELFLMSIAARGQLTSDAFSLIIFYGCRYSL